MLTHISIQNGLPQIAGARDQPSKSLEEFGNKYIVTSTLQMQGTNSPGPIMFSTEDVLMNNTDTNTVNLRVSMVMKAIDGTFCFHRTYLTIYNAASHGGITQIVHKGAVFVATEVYRKDKVSRDANASDNPDDSKSSFSLSTSSIILMVYPDLVAEVQELCGGNVEQDLSSVHNQLIVKAGQWKLTTTGIYDETLEAAGCKIVNISNVHHAIEGSIYACDLADLAGVPDPNNISDMVTMAQPLSVVVNNPRMFFDPLLPNLGLRFLHPDDPVPSATPATLHPATSGPATSANVASVIINLAQDEEEEPAAKRTKSASKPRVKSVALGDIKMDHKPKKAAQGVSAAPALPPAMSSAPHILSEQIICIIDSTPGFDGRPLYNVLYLNKKGEREQKHFYSEEMPPNSIAEYEAKLAKEKVSSGAAVSVSLFPTKVIASTPIPPTSKGPKTRLTNAQVKSILSKRDSTAYSGNVEPHYKTIFLEEGILKTEWLEVCELPVRKLNYFEADLDKEDEEEEREIQVVKVATRDRTTRSKGPAPPPPDIPFSDDMDEGQSEDEEEEEEDSEDEDDRDFIAPEDDEEE